MSAIPVVDVFAGPGGLNEGFSSLLNSDSSPIFEAVASFEMDPWACRTLRLRAALRHHRREFGANPAVYYDFLRGTVDQAGLETSPALEVAFKHAWDEIREMALGPDTRAESNSQIKAALEARGTGEPWILIGGPPCQAYSLAGRSRRKADPTFAGDHKHVLYREYLAIIEEFRPTVFVMENVKGMLSSQHSGGGIFRTIRDDLAAAGNGYDIRSFVVPDDDPKPSDFIIRTERYGIPQRRHRVILLGIQRESGLRTPGQLDTRPTTTVLDAIGDLPGIRSMVSPRGSDSETAWRLARDAAWLLAGKKGGRAARLPAVGAPFVDGYVPALQGHLRDWLVDDEIGGVALHESRAHMESDLKRYGYLAVMAERGKRPKLGDLPDALVPNHKNARNADAPFTDRFRVQIRDESSTTVVSHISKDGHYYIHYDPTQMRSLSVREAARLQTFPDDYFFVGGRTQQYHQVGNAVPPLLARQLGEIVADMFGIKPAAGRL
ncbi:MULTISPECIES: DNA cytosine methyltransferase [unclassified Nocardioides]|uniref:DNA cytosine methyltransferase n=1 Tax=unclassified Nocardioides TaxID=2615069 RepID=UPI0006F4CD73|nr:MULTISPECIES: DNA cytosine methyltransferase [unclassified Nocardioides]KRA31222.1 cytosine methyltransferase [Nocardioides sp. Root614]KRA87843.1 cytosine methyltransferase [Nocardioides sp. Root682]